MEIIISLLGLGFTVFSLFMAKVLLLCTRDSMIDAEFKGAAQFAAGTIIFLVCALLPFLQL